MTARPSSRGAIVEAAAQLIRVSGVQGTSITELIAASGTSAGAIYHHFPSKNAIVVEVAREAMAWPMSALATYRDRPASPSELLSFAVNALTAESGLGDLLIQLGAGAATDDELGKQLRVEFAQLRDSVDQTMRAWASANQVPLGRVHGYSQLLIGLTLGFVSQRRLVSDFDEKAYASQAVRLLALTPDAG